MTEIAMTRIKEAAMKLPEPVRSLILSEPDTLDASDLMSKLGTWEKLLKMEAGQK